MNSLAPCVLALLMQQQAPPPKAAPGPSALSGRVVDGLGRPVPGVDVKVFRGRDVPYAVFPTGPDGRYAGTPAPGDSTFLSFAKAGYEGFTCEPDPGVDVVFKLKVDWMQASSLPDLEGADLDRGLREVLASWEWATRDDRVVGFVLRDQAKFRPAFRRLIGDKDVGEEARDWLDLLDDPGDRDLFPGPRADRPAVEVKEVDLVEGLRASARLRNFFSSAPEPSIQIGFFGLTKELDCALIECGINMSAFTGIRWQFVFRKVGKTWELRSARQTGRG